LITKFSPYCQKLLSSHEKDGPSLKNVPGFLKIFLETEADYTIMEGDYNCKKSAKEKSIGK
jgi:hypothetical protein